MLKKSQLLHFIILLVIFFVSSCMPGKMDYNAGSAKILVGKCLVMHFFVSDKNNQWQSAEKSEILLNRDEAQNWLKNQATHYGVNVDFTNYHYGYYQDIELDYIPTNLDGRKYYDLMISDLFSKMEWDTSHNFYIDTKNKSGCDQILILFFVKGNGISYALPYNTLPHGKVNPLRYLESAVIFQKYNENTSVRAGTIAHEILHLFGADDFYHETRKEIVDRDNQYMVEQAVLLNMNPVLMKGIRSKSRENYSSSIMSSSWDINNANVDNLTAWIIGWHNTPDQWFEKWARAIDYKRVENTNLRFRESVIGKFLY